MNWKGVMPAITTCFTEDLRVDHSFVDEALPLAPGQRLHGYRCARFARRGRDLVVRREAGDSAHLRRKPFMGVDRSWLPSRRLRLLKRWRWRRWLPTSAAMV